MSQFGIDPSTDMTELGSRLCDELDRLRPVLSHPRLTSSVFKDVEDYRDVSAGNDNAGVTTLVSAMHVFYPSNVKDIRRQLAFLRDFTHPSTVLVTAHPKTFINVDRAITPTPKKFSTSHHQFVAVDDLTWTGMLPLTTEFRSNLADRIDQRRIENFEEWLHESAYEMRSAVGYSDVNPEEWDGDVHSLIDFLNEEDKAYINETDKAIRYLKNPVKWLGAPAVARVYDRN